MKPEHKQQLKAAGCPDEAVAQFEASGSMEKLACCGATIQSVLDLIAQFGPQVLAIVEAILAKFNPPTPAKSKAK